MKTITFRCQTYTGLDRLLGLLPLKGQARRIAKRLLRVCPEHRDAPRDAPCWDCGIYGGFNLVQARLVVEVAGHAFRVMTADGAVESCSREELPL